MKLTVVLRRWWLLALVLIVSGLVGFGHFMAVSLRGAAREAEGTAGRPAYRTVVSFGYVDVESKVSSLNPTVLGRVSDVLVHEGDHVSPGTVLFRLEDARAREQVEEARAAWDGAKKEQEDGRTLPERHRLALDQAQAAVKVAEYQRTVAQEALDNKERLAQLNQANNTDLAIAQGNLQAAEQEVKVKQLALDGLRLTDPKIKLALLEVNVRRAESLWKQAEFALAQYVVKAPTAGEVLRLDVGPGTVFTGAPRPAAIDFRPDGPLVVRAEVEQAFAALVAEGQEVTVEDETHSAGAWTGRVKRIADWFAQKHSAISEPLQFTDVRTLACLIELDPGSKKLRIGQRVLVTFKVPNR